MLATALSFFVIGAVAFGAVMPHLPGESDMEKVAVA